LLLLLQRCATIRAAAPAGFSFGLGLFLASLGVSLLRILRPALEPGEVSAACPDCGGMVKTATVMFGELLAERELGKAMQFLAMSDALLVVGSTVSVWPASDVVMRGAMRSLPIVIVNQGATDADMLATVKLDAAIGDALPDIVDQVLAG